jgi:WD40 repeat protein
MDTGSERQAGDALKRGVAYYKKGKMDEAIAAFTEAIRLDPTNAEAYARRGLAYDDLEKVDKAAADFDQAIRLNPHAAGEAPEPVPLPIGAEMVVKRVFLAAHTGAVGCVAFSPDGKTLASGANDHTVKLWEVATGKEKATLRGHTGDVCFVAFLPDAKTIASGSLDGTLRLWDVRTRRQRKTIHCFDAPGDPVSSAFAAISPHGKVLALIGPGEGVRLLDVMTGKESHCFRGEWKAAALSCDARLAIANDDTVAFRDSASGRSIATITVADSADEEAAELGQSVACVAFSPDAKTLAVGMDNFGPVKLYKVSTRRLKANLESGTQHVMSLAFSPDGKTLAVGRYLEGLQLWDLPTLTKKVELPPNSDAHGNSQYATSLAFSPDGKMLAAGGWEQVVRLWDLSKTR